MVEPRQKGFAFDWSRAKDICIGESIMLDQPRIGISSLARKKPQKAKVIRAHNISCSNVVQKLRFIAAPSRLLKGLL